MRCSGEAQTWDFTQALLQTRMAEFSTKIGGRRVNKPKRLSHSASLLTSASWSGVVDSLSLSLCVSVWRGGVVVKGGGGLVVERNPWPFHWPVMIPELCG